MSYFTRSHVYLFTANFLTTKFSRITVKILRILTGVASSLMYYTCISQIQLSQSPNMCQFGSVSPPALDDIVNKNIHGELRIKLGIPNRNFITASVAVVVDSFSLVFVAYVNTSGNFIIGVSMRVATTSLYSHDCIDLKLLFLPIVRCC